jgi:hypothetical protein
MQKLIENRIAKTHAPSNNSLNPIGVSILLIENLDGFGGVSRRVNSSVRCFLVSVLFGLWGLKTSFPKYIIVGACIEQLNEIRLFQCTSD